MNTYQPKASEIKRQWHLMDAKGEILGRLATRAAQYLIGKNKPSYSRNIDSGDHVVILNAEKVAVTGKKALHKVYRSHSGYPGGFKEQKYSQVLANHPERILENAISGMLPDNKLKADRLKRLNIVVGDKNPFENKFTK